MTSLLKYSEPHNLNIVKMSVHYASVTAQLLLLHEVSGGSICVVVCVKLSHT